MFNAELNVADWPSGFIIVRAWVPESAVLEIERFSTI